MFMIRTLLTLVQRKWQGMHQAAILLGVFSLASQLLGLVRDRILAHTIGPSATLDIYYAAFRIPDLIYLSIASLASITVLMPFLVERIDSKGTESARGFFNDVLSGFLLLLIIASGIIFLIMPKLAPLIAPGFDPEEMKQLVLVSRIMLLSPIFLGLSNMVGTVTQLMRKFVVFSLSPIFYNVGIIVGIIFLYPIMGIPGLAFGVALGALLHLLVQLPTVSRSGFRPQFSARLKQSSLRQVAALSLPRTLGLSMNSIALLVVIAIASTLGEGAISIFNLSLNLETVPVGIIGISYAVASFPLLAETFSRGKREEWVRHIVSAVRQIIFWSLPLAALFIVLRAQIVRVVLGSGSFTWADTRLVAACLAIFSLSLIAQNMILVSVRAFYSAHNTKTPLVINTLCALVIIGSAFSFVHLFETMLSFKYFIESLFRVQGVSGTVVLMLPLAYSTGTIINAFLNWNSLRKMYLPEKVYGIGVSFLQSTIASLVLGVTAYGVLNLLASYLNTRSFTGILLQGLIAGVLGIIAAGLILGLLKNKELRTLMRSIKRTFWKADIIPTE